MTPALLQRAKDIAGPRMTTRVRCLLRGHGLPRWGKLRRTTPLSSTFGFERGTPIGHPILQTIFRENSTLSIFGGELRRRSDTLNLAARFQSPSFRDWPPIHTELQA